MDRLYICSARREIESEQERERERAREREREREREKCQKKKRTLDEFDENYTRIVTHKSI